MDKLSVAPLVQNSVRIRNIQSDNQQLKHAAQELSASFLAEMLKAAKFGQRKSEFAGSAGEEHFQTFLYHEHAKLLTQNSSLGLVEKIYEALLRNDQLD